MTVLRSHVYLDLARVRYNLSHAFASSARWFILGQKLNKDGYYKYVLLVCDTELDSRSVTIRSLCSASQELVPLDALVSRIAELQNN